MELKNENNELEKNNSHLKKIIFDLTVEKTPRNNYEDLVTELKAKLVKLEEVNKLILKKMKFS